MGSNQSKISHSSQIKDRFEQKETPGDDYTLDVIEVSSLARAIKNEQPTINLEITLACQNLPEFDLFGFSNPMVVCFKRQFNPDTAEYEEIEIGWTEVIPNELNPRFIKTFIYSYNQEKQDEIEFRIYHVDKLDKVNNKDLKQHNLIGRVETNMREIVEAVETLTKQITEVKRRKKVSYLKITSSEYDGGNSKYDISISANGFTTKQQVFVTFEVYRINQWMPIHRTEVLENQKQIRFADFQIATNKFPDEDKCRLKLKVFEFNNNKGQDEIGETEEMILSDLFTKNKKSQFLKTYKQSFLVGSIQINKFQKIIRDSFISYIVNGAHLHLIVAIDFSRSNDSQSLHDLQNDTNQYIEAIREIIGVLQYFDYYNQMAFYGFAAKLQPYYRTVAQCFALNGNYFEPIVVGGVEQLINLYKQTLKKIKTHGPTKVSQILDLATAFAQAEPQTSDYYVCVIFTDGNFSDQQQAIEKIIKASNHPLSIILVGIGQGQFELLDKLDSDGAYLKSTNNESAKRDIVQFIPYTKYKKSGKDIVKEVFAQLPQQYLGYMKKKQIKLNKKNKKGLKNAKSQFIATKISQSKNNSDKKYVVYIPQFLTYKKTQLRNSLKNLGFELSPLLEKMNIAVNDISYFIQVESSLKQSVQQSKKNYKQVSYLKETNKLDDHIDKKMKENEKKTLAKLQKTQSNQFGRVYKTKDKKATELIKQLPVVLQHPCVQCKQREISLMYLQCGHICSCQQCQSKYCQICKAKSKAVRIIF